MNSGKSKKTGNGGSAESTSKRKSETHLVPSPVRSRSPGKTLSESQIEHLAAAILKLLLAQQGRLNQRAAEQIIHAVYKILVKL